MRFGFILITIIALSTVLAYAKDDPMTQLLSARSLKCHFGQGTSTTWSGSKPKTLTARFDQDIHYDSIDFKNQSARLIGNIGAGNVKVFATDLGVSFIESASAVADLTTVFPIYGNGRDFIAVDTRHVMVSGASMAEQYYGSCQIMQ